jgi:cell division protein FtsI/penicillin-binding protein 2
VYQESASKVDKKRLYFLLMILFFFWLSLEVNLFRIQIINNDIFEKAAKNQYEKKIDLPAKRGAICDRNGNKLATTVILYDLAADPKLVKNKLAIASACAKAFGHSKRYYLKKLNRERRFVYLERRVSMEKIKPILNLKDPGLVKRENFRRFNPYGKLAAPLLGFTDPDDRGLSGIELQFEKDLSGKAGEAMLLFDARRNEFYDPDYALQKPQQGSDVYLTIDKNIQTIADEELEAGVIKAKAKSGMVVVMDPKNGAILALSSYPTFDANSQGEYKSSSKRNRVITDVFEPGSTMKIFTAAALLQENLAKKSDLVYCENGRYKIYNHYMNDSKKHGWLTFEKVIEYSSNIGMIKLSQQLPANTLFRYLKGFGFGKKTGVGLNGEAGGMLRQPAKWSGLSKASVSIGQEISVTALQIAAAYGAVVNGGYLYRPYIIDGIMDEGGHYKKMNEPQEVRQVISPYVCETLKSMMSGVVKRGTAKYAKMSNLSVGGKTGTAQKFNTKTKHYYKNRYMASFIGFGPLENTEYVCGVFVNEPTNGYYGGTVAAPIFRSIMEKILGFEENDSSMPENSNLKLVKVTDEIPDLKGLSIAGVKAILEEKNIDYEIVGSMGTVRKVSQDDGVLKVMIGQPTVRVSVVPKLTGLSLREAMTKIDLSKINVRIKGSGIIKKQSVKPGKKIKNNQSLILTCN